MENDILNKNSKHPILRKKNYDIYRHFSRKKNLRKEVSCKIFLSTVANNYPSKNLLKLIIF